MRSVLLALAVVASACGSTSAPARPAGDPPGSGSAAPPGPGSAAPAPCAPTDCGPPLRMPNRQCPDGSMAGPTDQCIRNPQGRCVWEIRNCP